jgi:Mor family transcriptional regulator
MIFLGNETAIRLCTQFPGYQLPSHDRLYRCLRRQAIVAEHLTKGTSVATLALKYNLPQPSVRKILTQYRKRMRVLARL